MNSGYVGSIREIISDKSYNNSNKWNIMFGVDSKYVRYAGVLILSIIDKNPNKNIVFHIFCDFVEETDFKICKNIVSRSCGIEIKFYYILQEVVKDFPEGNGWNYSIYYRAIAPNILYGKVDKVLYLDADIICDGDISELWNIDLGDKIAAVVDDGMGVNNVAQKLQALGFPPHCDKKYFNSGVMLININRYKERNVLKKFIKVIREEKEKLYFWDQDAFNIVIRDEVIYIDKKYNYQKFRGDSSDLCFIHFVGMRKPWFIDFDYYLFDKWRKYYYSSEWKAVRLIKKNNVSYSEYRYQAEYHFTKGKYLDAIKNYLKYLYKKLKNKEKT